MKTLGRIFIILAAFAIVMGITYVAVNAGGPSSNVTRFESSERTEFPGGQFERRPEGRERESGGWMFGLIKNVGIIAVAVILIALPRNLLQRRRRSAPVLAE